ncbi:MAG: sigma-70 family RNA polymerase sigma factor [Actinomycetota bacterium]|nr:sigma-70 family RNA polymerase sigma factor [Actinomycetota bacterium]
MRERAWVMDGGEIVEATEPRPGRLEELYIRHVPEAARLAFVLTHDAATAEDVAQEAFIRVAGRLRHLRTPDAFGSYLRRTVVNLCISHHRREKIARVYAQRERARSASREPAIELPDVETHDELRTALAQLPDRQRAAVVLRFYADLPEDGVAEALGCTIGAARALVFRGMETLRSRIGGEEQ